MDYLIGATLALAVGGMSAWIGMDRDRALYPAALLVIASLYDLFALAAGSGSALKAELWGTAAFYTLALIGFRTSLWWVALGLIGHGVFDFFHPALIANPGVPVWWPGFCMSYDVVAGLFLAWRLTARTGPQSSFALDRSWTGRGCRCRDPASNV